MAPLVMADLTFLMRMVLAAIVVTGLSLLMGYAGQASLGQGAFVAAGALTVALGTTRWGCRRWSRCCWPRRWWPGRSPPWSACPCCGCRATTSRSAPSPCC